MSPSRSRKADSADLDGYWRNAEYCAIDVETTGLDRRRDDIVSVGTAHIRDGRIICADNYYSLVRPARDISPASMRIHGLRPADLGHAPHSIGVAREVANQFADRIVIAHAAWIEQAFLGRLLRQAGLKLAGPLLDTAGLARALGYADATIRGHEPSLELLARQLSLPVYSPHNALGDAFTTAAVFLAMATRAEQQAAASGQPVSLGYLLEMAAAHAY